MIVIVLAQDLGSLQGMRDICDLPDEKGDRKKRKGVQTTFKLV